MSLRSVACAAASASALLLGHSLARAASCESLSALTLAQTTLTSAALVAAGAFVPPGPPADQRTAAQLKGLPAFCRVQGIIRPTSESHIEFEVWLPLQGWRGRYEGVGNGGLAGSINYAQMAAALRAGLATSSTDTGHRADGTDGAWAVNHPQKIIDYGYRAIHLTALEAQAIVRAFYGEQPFHSYFSSCSNGGREALLEAERFPGDYDGIIAGAPALAISRILAAWHSNQLALQGAGYIPASKYPAIEAAVLAACDTSDGDRDGVVDEPARCGFKPEALRCAGAESDSCLTPTQIAALERIYAGPHSSTGAAIYPGFLPGGETGPLGWEGWISGQEPGKSIEMAFLTGGGPGALWGEPGWDFRTASVDDDVRHRSINRILDASDTNLSAFRERGGKLILFHGWSDPALPPLETVRYYERVLSTMGRERASDFIRLYMVPGMQHCAGGPGTDEFGAIPAANADPRSSLSAALERWVENGGAPGAISARKFSVVSGTPRVVRTRPLCPYPEVARYRGSGSVDEAANFTCSARKSRAPR